MIQAGFVICSRANSRRVPKKPFADINGLPLIAHLIKRCLRAGRAGAWPVILAIPPGDYDEYSFLRDTFKNENFYFYLGEPSDPLARTHAAARNFDLENVIRVCHDKVFIDTANVHYMFGTHHVGKFDYTYSSTLAQGAGLELISLRSLALAASKFKNVEHISYAIKCVTANSKDVAMMPITHHRFLVDYPEDLKVLNLLFHALGNDCTLQDAIQYMDSHYWVSRINRAPRATVYTCAHNAEKWISKCMGSIAMQQEFESMEYILIDDKSTDNTAYLMSKFCTIYQNTKFIGNSTNLGLASSSNIALSEARGKYILRLDADDYFVHDRAIADLIFEAEKTGADLVYPDNYFGSFKNVQKGSDAHHVGGSLFNTRAANHVKFTDGLRNYDGLDFFVRAQNQLGIAYLEKPIFFYRQHDKSMSKSNPEERKHLKEVILNAAQSKP